MAQRTSNNPPFGYKFLGDVADDITELFSKVTPVGDFEFDGYFYTYDNFMMDWPNVPANPTIAEVQAVIDTPSGTTTDWATKMCISSVGTTFTSDAITQCDVIISGLTAEKSDIQSRTAWYTTHKESTLAGLVGQGNMTQQEVDLLEIEWNASQAEAIALEDEIDSKLLLIGNLKTFYIDLQNEANTINCGGV